MNIEVLSGRSNRVFPAVKGGCDSASFTLERRIADIAFRQIPIARHLVEEKSERSNEIACRRCVVEVPFLRRNQDSRLPTRSIGA